MLELIDRQPDIDVLESEYTRLLGYPLGRALEGRSREIADMTRDWFQRNGNPWYYLRETQSIELGDAGFGLDGVSFSSAYVRKQLDAAEAHAAVVAAISAGDACVERSQQLWREGKPDEYFFMEMFSGAVVEHLAMIAGARLCAWADAQGMVALPHYSPGYPEWDVAEQNALLGLLRDGARIRFPVELTALDSGMLKPKKSLLAVFGITRRIDKASAAASLVPCESCSLPSCAYRRKPYFLDTMREMNETETTHSNGHRNGARALGLLLDAQYSISRKALRKWSDTRLVLDERPDGSIEARFRYEGTTCSNLGHPLEYLYTISLGGPATRYRVQAARCEPAAGDEGHRKQCEYLKNARRLTAAVASEKPLLGKPLDDVLSWSRPSSPSGCFCDESSRNHKWALVYEVLHFALAQRRAAQSEEMLATGTD